MEEYRDQLYEIIYQSLGSQNLGKSELEMLLEKAAKKNIKNNVT